jgi:hypothetical protein
MAAKLKTWRVLKMRKSCLECVVKHLGSAAVYIEEVQTGYPNYFGFVYGQLDHAASECFEEIPELAWTIREHRIKWAETRRSENQHRIPFEAMFAYIDMVEEVGEPIEIPKGIYAGLKLGNDGTPVFSMDTRPVEEIEYGSRNGLTPFQIASDVSDVNGPLNHSTPS